MFINVPIVLYENRRDIDYEMLGIDADITMQDGLINVHHIVSVYPENDEQTIVVTTNNEFLIGLPYRKVVQIILDMVRYVKSFEKQNYQR